MRFKGSSAAGISRQCSRVGKRAGAERFLRARIEQASRGFARPDPKGLGGASEGATCLERSLRRCSTAARGLGRGKICDGDDRRRRVLLCRRGHEDGAVGQPPRKVLVELADRAVFALKRPLCRGASVARRAGRVETRRLCRDAARRGRVVAMQDARGRAEDERREKDVGQQARERRVKYTKRWLARPSLHLLRSGCLN